jgi:primosomal protein N' (replication factor Y)
MDPQHSNSGESMYAEVIIPLALPRNYTWSVPETIRSAIKTGCRVEVGLKNKKYAGIVVQLHHDKPEGFEPKEIFNLLDTEPILHEVQLRFWKWMAHYYMCTEGEVMAAALPAHFKLSSETILVLDPSFGSDFSELDHDEYLVAEALQIKQELKLSEVQQILQSSRVYPVIKRLIEAKVCFVWESLKETYRPKKETFIRLAPAYTAEEELARLLNEDPKLQRAEKQMELLLAFLHLQKTEGEVSKPALITKSGASDAQLKGLVSKGILVTEKRETDRLQYLPRNIEIDFTLSPAQDQAVNAISEVFRSNRVCLLHGITSSGKTQVYIRQIEAFVRQGKQVLYLLPEIALTSQIIRRLQKHFGGYIGIYHSKFNQNERMEIWNKTRTGELMVILGVRSSLFLPFGNLGLIIVDEEHETSYKQQEPAPRYHARDAAIYCASLFGAHVLLGSATPSLESYFNARQQKYGLVELLERFGGLQLPVIEWIDTKSFGGRKTEKLILTPPLQESIGRTLDAGRQVILFQNRRGYAPYQICRVCGWIPHCRNCDVSLTYHKNTTRLHCHYCGEQYPPPSTCPACGSHDFLQRNFGTERIEEQLESEFAKARIARMDLDSVRGKTAHDSLVQSFEQRRIDILVGTQMVVKGLDFDHVDLVGILDADSLLGFAEFRVNERAFQLMEQVSGRAGRKSGMGKVLVQISNTRHPLLPYIQAHDYKGFYEQELEGRRKFNYPPFSRIILLTFRHREKETAAAASRNFARALQQEFGDRVVGPAEPVVGRIRNFYLMELLLKLPKDGARIQLAKQMIRQQTMILNTHPSFKSVQVIPDIDPV